MFEEYARENTPPPVITFPLFERKPIERGEVDPVRELETEEWEDRDPFSMRSGVTFA